MKIVQEEERRGLGVIEMMDGGEEEGKEAASTNRLSWKILGGTFCREVHRERLRDAVLSR